MKLRNLLKYLYALPCVLFCAVILHLSWTNTGYLDNLLKNENNVSLSYLTDNAERIFQDTIIQKYDFIELNGAMGKALGYNTVNNTTRLKNGMLGGSPTSSDREILAERIHNLSDFLAESGIPFLYVPIPQKSEFYDSVPAPGYTLKPENYTEFLSLLNESSVSTLDMNTWFQENNWSTADTYFRTDHHWRPEAAFATVVQIMKYYDLNYGLTYDNGSLDPENWNYDIYPNWLLGSLGKRTGSVYAGLDDFPYIYSKFPTDYHIARITASKSSLLDHETSLNYSDLHLNTRNFQDYPYYSYIGGDYPFVYIRNNLAAHNKKIVFMGDSFRIPAEAFLSTQFTEIYHIDMRHYSDGTLAEFIQQLNPDYVLALFVGSVDGPKHNYGLDSWQENFASKTLSPPLLTAETVSLPEAQNNQDYHLITAEIAPGAYSLSLENTLLTRNFQANPESPGMLQQASVIDLNTNSPVATRYFLANEPERQNWLFTVPENPEAHYAVVLYNGTNQYTLGNTSEVHNLTLSQYN